MVVEARPICVYAKQNLKRNSTKLIIVMCFGIALALYGIYIQSKSRVNPSYFTTMSMASHWLYNRIGQRLLHPLSYRPSAYFGQCGDPQRSMFVMRYVFKPVAACTSLLNALINLTQIILLKVYCSNVRATKAIIGLSAFGLVLGFFCIVGSFATCKLMCITCLGVHHMIIMYLANKRRHIINNMLCPVENVSTGCSSSAPGTSGIPVATKSSSKTSPSNSITSPSLTGRIFGRQLPPRNQPPANSARRRQSYK